MKFFGNDWQIGEAPLAALHIELARLAACFIDSLATLGFSAMISDLDINIENLATGGEQIADEVKPVSRNIFRATA